MTKINVFNTTFEISLRIIILLESFDKPLTLDMLYIADFISTYGKEFGVSKENLNGENQYKFCEIPNRRKLVRAAIKELILNGWIKPVQINSGFVYMITKDGKDYCQDLNSNYAVEYRQITNDVRNYVSNKSERAILSFINELSAKSLRKGAKV